MNKIAIPERIFVYTKPVDMRKSFDGLFVLVAKVLRQDPMFGNTPAVGLSTLSKVKPGKGRLLREEKDLALVAVDEHPEAGGIAGHLWKPTSSKCQLIRLNIEVESVLSCMQKSSKEELSLEHFGLHAEGIARTVREALRLTPPATFG